MDGRKLAAFQEVGPKEMKPMPLRISRDSCHTACSHHIADASRGEMWERVDLGHCKMGDT